MIIFAILNTDTIKKIQFRKTEHHRIHSCLKNRKDPVLILEYNFTILSFIL